MREFRSKIAALASIVFTLSITPALAFAGAGLVTYGAYLIYHPAGFITGGILLIIAAIDSSS